MVQKSQQNPESILPLAISIKQSPDNKRATKRVSFDLGNNIIESCLSENEYQREREKQTKKPKVIPDLTLFLKSEYKELHGYDLDQEKDSQEKLLQFWKNHVAAVYKSSRKPVYPFEMTQKMKKNIEIRKQRLLDAPIFVIRQKVQDDYKKFEKIPESHVIHTIAHDFSPPQNEQEHPGVKQTDQISLKRILGLYVFGPPLTNSRDPLLISKFQSPYKTQQNFVRIKIHQPQEATMLESQKLIEPPELYTTKRFKNNLSYYTYLSEYYKKINLKFDPATYYESQIDKYSEQDQEIYNFYLFLFEQIRQTNDQEIKCDSIISAFNAISVKNITGKDRPRLAKNKQKADHYIKLFFKPENFIKRVIFHLLFIDKNQNRKNIDLFRHLSSLTKSERQRNLIDHFPCTSSDVLSAQDILDNFQKMCMQKESAPDQKKYNYFKDHIELFSDKVYQVEHKREEQLQIKSRKWLLPGVNKPVNRQLNRSCDQLEMYKQQEGWRCKENKQSQIQTMRSKIEGMLKFKTYQKEK